MTGQELIDTIVALIDADMIAMADFDADTPCVLCPKDIARRAIERCGVQDEASVEDVEFEVRGALLCREALDLHQAGEPIAATLAHVRRAFQRQLPGFSEAAIDSLIENHLPRLLADSRVEPSGSA